MIFTERGFSQKISDYFRHPCNNLGFVFIIIYKKKKRDKNMNYWNTVNYTRERRREGLITGRTSSFDFIVKRFGPTHQKILNIVVILQRVGVVKNI